jgi:CheY-like chemotaxis protein
MGAADVPGREQDVVEVAVVEDDEATGDVLTSSLVDNGHTVRRFRTGAEALESLGGRTPAVKASVILLDVELGVVDGFAVLERLRADGVLRDTKVLMLTGRTTEEDVLRALALGAFDHMAKPFSVPVLLQKVTRALER